MAEVGEKILGKGVVFAKDTPNFIANRIGAFSVAAVIRTMVEEDYRIEEVEEITGPVLGRPKSATFRTADIVGLDVMVHVAKNLLEGLPEGEGEYFRFPPFLDQMVKNRWLGQKTGQGFYKRVRRDGREDIHVLDFQNLEYRSQERVNLPSLEMAKNIEDLRERIRTLVMSPDRGGQFAWKSLKKTLLYSAEKIPEISDDVVSIDRAMRWGTLGLGPFPRSGDAIGNPP
jgi:3-hydroxyacyl-CoA dehydrogenase